MKVIIKAKDLFGNECRFIEHDKPTKDTLLFVDNYKKRNLTVFLIIPTDDKPKLTLMLGIVEGYIYTTKAKNLMIHEMKECIIVYVNKRKLQSNSSHFKKFFNKTIANPVFYDRDTMNEISGKDLDKILSST